MVRYAGSGRYRFKEVTQRVSPYHDLEGNIESIMHKRGRNMASNMVRSITFGLVAHGSWKDDE